MKKTKYLFALVGILSIATNPLRAEWTLIDDFNSYTVGETIDAQSNGEGEWVSPDFADFYGVELDPADQTNQVLSAYELDSGAKQVYLEDGRVLIPEGETGTLFVRIYRGDVDTHVNFGLSDVEEPTNWPDFEAQFRDQTGVSFAREGGAFTAFDNVDELAEGEWINIWLVVDNENDFTEYYMQSDESVPEQLQLEAGGNGQFDFRNGTADDITTFFLRTNNAADAVHLGPWYLDDIYFDATGSNLSNPVGGGAGETGDFDLSGVLDLPDINLLVEDVASGLNTPRFDLTGDGLVNTADISNWVVDLKNTWIGDANLDGEFSSADFVAVFTGGKFETAEPANWGEGDWNGDGAFTSGDFVTAFTDGGYENGPRAAAAAVPEPGAIFLLASGGLALALSRSRRRNRAISGS